jgi:hypothetical protein
MTRWTRYNTQNKYLILIKPYLFSSDAKAKERNKEIKIKGYRIRNSIRNTTRMTMFEFHTD